MVAVKFKDHFSTNSTGYSTYRPSYPGELYSYLASLSPQTDIAWDCATGTGQAAVALADHFDSVIATDGSQSQIENAGQHTRVDYRVATAEKSGIESHSIDLITVAQALHWFDLDAFIDEASRVMTQDAVLAVWTYNLLHVSDDIDAAIYRLYDDIIGDYWPFERNTVEQGYADIELPYTVLESPRFEMRCEWDLPQLLGYLNTWSAVRGYQQDKGVNPVEMVYDDIQQLWGDAVAKQTINWPLALRLWRR